MKKKILVCDDEKDIVDMLTIAVGGQDVEVLGLTDSTNLMQTIASFGPDVLLLDIWMPELPGDVALQTLRQTARYSGLPVIIMSASKDGREAALRAGATKFIAKPFSINEIRDMVIECLAMKR